MYIIISNNDDIIQNVLQIGLQIYRQKCTNDIQYKTVTHVLKGGT